MRDTRGRYLNVKAITDIGPAWAKGCTACTFGIVSAPELTQAAPIFLERIIQALDGDITFCTCQAGQSYRVALRNRHRAIIEQDKRDARIFVHKVAGSEQPLTPDSTLRIDSPLEVARDAIATARARNVPSVHMEVAS